MYSCPVFETLSSTLGYPTPLSYVPVMGMDINPMESYWSRTKNLFYAIINTYYYDRFYQETTKIFRDKYGLVSFFTVQENFRQDFPEVDKLAAESDMVLVNTDEFLDIPRPMAPNMVHVGGLGAGDYVNMPLGEVPLTLLFFTDCFEVFEKEMKRGVNGVIYFSLGTVVNVTILPSVYESVAVLAKVLIDFHSSSYF